MMKAITLLMMACALAPTAAVAKDPPVTGDAGAVRYFLPKTVVTATATLKLKDCATGDADVELALAARGEPDLGTAYTFDPTGLSSWRQSRDFSISVNANGTLAGFSSTSEDKTASIIGNILKTIVTFAGILDAKGTASGKCNAATADAMRRVTVIKAQLAKLRPLAWTDTDPMPGEKDSALADALAKELADIQTNKLTIVVTKEVPIAAGGAIPTAELQIDWSKTPFQKWFTLGMLPPSLEKLRLAMSGSVPAASPLPAKCARFVEIPQPALVRMTILRAPKSQDDPVSALVVPAQQLGRVGKLCLDAPVFASRTINATFDSFGLMTKLDWKSNATGDAASAALAAVADQAVAFRNATKPETETAQLKDQGDLLEQQIRVQKLRHCLELMQAGTACPS